MGRFEAMPTFFWIWPTMDFLPHTSYLGITIVLILTGSGLPIPEEVPIITAGILAAKGTLDPRLAFLCCVFGAIAGDSIMYAIGYYFGHGVLREHPGSRDSSRPNAKNKSKSDSANTG